MINRPGHDQGGGEVLFVALEPKYDDLTTQAGAAIDTLIASRDPGIVDAAVAGFTRRISGLEGLYPGDEVAQNLFDHSRFLAAELLVAGDQIEQAASVLAAMSGPKIICKSLIALAPNQSPLRLESAVLTALDQAKPDVALGLLRRMRRLVLEHGGERALVVLERINKNIAVRVSGDYDPVRDWAESEASDRPRADWPALEAIVRDDSMWPAGDTVDQRLLVTQVIAYAVDTILKSDSIDGSLVPNLRALAAGNSNEINELPARSQHFSAMLALAFYAKGEANFGRSLAGMISEPTALTYIVDSLILNDLAGTARELVLTISDRRVMIDILLDTAWPDGVAKKILEDLVVLRTERTNGGRGPISSPYPIRMRTECIEALAQRREQEGRQQEAEELRGRARLLQWQEENRVIKFMPRGGKRR